MEEQLKNCYIDDYIVTKEDDPTVKVEAHLPAEQNTKIATITVENSETEIFAPTKTDVSISDTLPTGTKIATLTIDGTPIEIKAPESGSKVQISDVSTVGAKIATLTIDGTQTVLRASGSGSVVNVEQKLSSGKEIAAITIDDQPVSIYSPYFEDEEINLMSIADCANAIKKLLVLLGIDASKIHTV